ncbi:lipopolysaccharide biosynthesis protein [Sphingobacterium paramultivorum]|uniref:Lipopolysaccharide biosynthesis protein n=1 Tax=Sphingobacterium paramultivorum TaxID=2886510 RepID=A0A7G5E707_9SPHI|nr:lipopolysaccharide biosynthesis protein [Sphingobacterium paramultivorum]QMV69782.1 lipopolysaccharide biosynthesis protein [Sphingobacterium paramultivorum]WSO13607.1 lipopolysaccharide biosynthesis protein [Sphingobacterium paramultivorum]
MGVTLYSSRVILGALGVSDYGIYNVVGGIVAMMSFLNSAMAGATQRYLSFDIGKGDINSLQKTFSATLSVHFLIAFIVFFLGETIGLWYINYKMVFPPERSIAVNIVFQFSLLTLFLDIIQVPYNALILARERMNVYAYVSILEAGLKLVVAFSLLWFGVDKLILYSILTFCLVFIIRNIYKYYCKRNFPESKYKFEYNKSYFVELISFSGWNLFGTMSLVAKNQGVNMILNLFFGTMINASYGIAMQVQGAVNQFVSNFQTALNPQIIQNYAGGNKEKSVSLMFLGAKFSFLLMMILVFPLIFNVETILKIWLGHVPEYTSLFIKISLITILIDSLSGPLMTGILATGKIKYYNVIIGSFNILTLPCSYILLKLGFPPTVAFQILLTFSVFSFLLRFFLVKKEFQINISDFFKKVFLRIIATVGFLILCIYLLSKSTFLMENIFINVPIIILNAIFAILSFGISNNERGHILSILRSKIRRKNDK